MSELVVIARDTLEEMIERATIRGIKRVMSTSRTQATLLTARQVAELMEVSVKTVHRKKKDIGFVMVGKAVRFPEPSVNDYINRMKV